MSCFAQRDNEYRTWICTERAEKGLEITMNIEERLMMINDRGEELLDHYLDLTDELHDALELACRGQATLEFALGDAKVANKELRERMI